MSEQRQTKQHQMDSFMEALSNIVVGMLTSGVAQPFIAHAVGIKMSLGQNLFLVASLTLISLLRQYFLRRLFDGQTIWQKLKKLTSEVKP